jgi:uncharacterized protein YbbK (DUF523 family)
VGLLKADQKVVMVSGCLLGLKCRFDGTSRETPELPSALQGYRLVPFCPEVSGGLTAPRLPAEIQVGDGAAVLSGKARVMNQAGFDCTEEFIRGAETILELVKNQQPEFVVLKAKSPSCGVGEIYDGSFSGKLKDGDGVTTALLRDAGITVYSEIDWIVSIAGKK